MYLEGSSKIIQNFANRVNILILLFYVFMVPSIKKSEEMHLYPMKNFNIKKSKSLDFSRNFDL